MISRSSAAPAFVSATISAGVICSYGLVYPKYYGRKKARITTLPACWKKRLLKDSPIIWKNFCSIYQKSTAPVLLSADFYYTPRKMESYMIFTKPLWKFLIDSQQIVSSDIAPEPFYFLNHNHHKPSKKQKFMFFKRLIPFLWHFFLCFYLNVLYGKPILFAEFVDNRLDFSLPIPFFIAVLFSGTPWKPWMILPFPAEYLPILFWTHHPAIVHLEIPEIHSLFFILSRISVYQRDVKCTCGKYTAGHDREYK